MNDFSYLTKKILEAEFSESPFKHIIINNFFSQEHFYKITNSPLIKVSPSIDTRDLINKLIDIGYEVQPFPGCVENIDDYISYVEKNEFKSNLVKGYGKKVIEGYGMTMRLKSINDSFLQNLIDFFNSSDFQSALKSKFGLPQEDIDIETAFQKNLKGYEISPHCDTSRKALTYMVNIYNEDHCEKLDMHTHLLELKNEYKYLYDFWKYNDVDPVWIPWSWAKTVKNTNTNNSISIFRPSYDTLHAVRVTNDHLINQRNQIYGNLWYKHSKKGSSKPFDQLDLVNGVKSNTVFRKLKSLIKQ